MLTYGTWSPCSVEYRQKKAGIRFSLNQTGWMTWDDGGFFVALPPWKFWFMDDWISTMCLEDFAVGVDEDLQQHVPLAFCFLNIGVLKIMVHDGHSWTFKVMFHQKRTSQKPQKPPKKPEKINSEKQKIIRKLSKTSRFFVGGFRDLKIWNFPTFTQCFLVNSSRREEKKSYVDVASGI